MPLVSLACLAANDITVRARSAFESAAYPEAERLYREALKSQPDSPQIWNALGVTLNREQRFDEAAQAFRAALKLSPEVKGLQLNLGIALFRAGKLDDAARELKPVSEIEQARELLALSYAGLGQFDRALPLLERLAVTSTDPTIHIALANAYEALGRKAEVDRAMAHMFQVVPDSAPLHAALGDAYGDSDTEKALGEYRKALDMDPSLSGVHLRMGRLLWKVRRFDEAEPLFKSELKTDPANADARYYLGTIALYRDDARAAIPLLHDFVQLQPRQSNGFFELGRALMKEKQVDRAIAAFERAASLAPGDANAHYQLGQAYRAAGRLGEAQRELTESKRLRSTTLDTYNQEFQSEAKRLQKEQ